MKHAFLDKYSHMDSPIHRLDARAKIVAFISLTVTCVTTSPDAWPAFAGYSIFLGIILLLSHVPLRFALFNSLRVVPFVFVVSVFIPFFHKDSIIYNVGPVHISLTGLKLFANIMITALIASFSITLLISTTPFPDLLRGFEQLRVPKVFIMLASFAYRLIFVLMDEAGRMRRARDSRGWSGRWLWQAKTIGHLVGALFLRSYERGERVYLAMVARGFQGKATTMGATRLKAADYVFTVVFLGMLAALRLGIG